MCARLSGKFCVQLLAELALSAYRMQRRNDAAFEVALGRH
jgi:hypothetical protein